MSIDMLGMLSSPTAAGTGSGTTGAVTGAGEGGDFADIMAAEVKATDPATAITGGKPVPEMKSLPPEVAPQGQQQASATDVDAADGKGRDDLLAPADRLAVADDDQDAVVGDAADTGVAMFIPAADQLMMAAPLPAPVERQVPASAARAETGVAGPVADPASRAEVAKATPEATAPVAEEAGPDAAVAAEDAPAGPSTMDQAMMAAAMPVPAAPQPSATVVDSETDGAVPVSGVASVAAAAQGEGAPAPVAPRVDAGPATITGNAPESAVILAGKEMVSAPGLVPDAATETTSHAASPAAQLASVDPAPVNADRSAQAAAASEGVAAIGKEGAKASASAPALEVSAVHEQAAADPSAPSGGALADKVASAGVIGTEIGTGASSSPAITSAVSVDGQRGQPVSSPVSGGDQQFSVPPAANDDGAAPAVIMVPEGVQAEAPASAQPGEATSLLDMVKSILPQRGRGGSFATLPQNSGPVATIATSSDGGSIVPGSATAQAVAPQVAGPIQPQAIVPDGKGAAAVDAGVDMGAGASALAAPVIATPDKAVTGRGRKEDVAVGKAAASEGHDKAAQAVAGDDASGGTATTVVADASVAVPDSFGIKAMGMSSPLVNAPSSLSVDGVSAAAGGVGASLDQKVIDMGVSGQWIDDIARQIASISDNQGRGSFQIASPTLGAVRVDILPGAEGSHVHLTAETEAAQAALVRDKDRLVQDAHMAAIRIGEVRIDRMAPVSESQRSDTDHDGQQNGNGQTGLAQNGGQNGQQGARQDGAAAFAGQYSGGSPKNPFTRTVIPNAGMSEAKPVPGEGRTDTARYA